MIYTLETVEDRAALQSHTTRVGTHIRMGANAFDVKELEAS